MPMYGYNRGRLFHRELTHKIFPPCGLFQENYLINPISPRAGANRDINGSPSTEHIVHVQLEDRHYGTPIDTSPTR